MTGEMFTPTVGDRVVHLVSRTSGVVSAEGRIYCHVQFDNEDFPSIVAVGSLIPE